MEEIKMCLNCIKISKEHRLEVKALREFINKIANKKVDWDIVRKEFIEWNDGYGYDSDDYNKIKELVEKQLKGD